MRTLTTAPTLALLLIFPGFGASELIAQDNEAIGKAVSGMALRGVGHFCQEDAPETLVALIQGFVQANP